jgi:hypothetical protein
VGGCAQRHQEWPGSPRNPGSLSFRNANRGSVFDPVRPDVTLAMVVSEPVCHAPFTSTLFMMGNETLNLFAAKLQISSIDPGSWPCWVVDGQASLAVVHKIDLRTHNQRTHRELVARKGHHREPLLAELVLEGLELRVLGGQPTLRSLTPRFPPS